MSRYVSYRDFDWVLMTFVLILCTLTIVGTLISDILLAWADPRIRLE